MSSGSKNSELTSLLVFGGFAVVQGSDCMSCSKGPESQTDSFNSEWKQGSSDTSDR